MKIAFVPLPGSTLKHPKRSKSQLKSRSSYPTVSLITAKPGPLKKLAWIFGFAR